MSYNGKNKHVKRLLKRFGGKVMPYKDLPREAQLAMLWYMAADGEAWELPWDDSKLEEIRQQAVKKYGQKKFGLALIPRDALETAVAENFDADPDKQVMRWKTFADYHQWYMENSLVDDHGKSVWPVIFNSYDDELFQDGWHRFHSYVKGGVEVVPCLYYVKNSGLET